MPSNETLWKCTADQEHMNTDKNPYQHQTDADWKVNQQQKENNGIFGKPVKRKKSEMQINILNVVDET